MTARRPAWADEVFVQLDKLDKGQREQGEYIGLIAADTREIHGWLAEAGLNSTGEGRRRLNQLLEERKERDIIAAALKRPIGLFVAIVGFVSTFGWAVMAVNNVIHLFK